MRMGATLVLGAACAGRADAPAHRHSRALDDGRSGARANLSGACQHARVDAHRAAVHVSPSDLWSPAIAALLGLLWIFGRVIYFIGYVSEAKKRFPGFFIQSTAAFVMLFGALGRITYLMVTNTTP